jgi:TRAP-type uncharacterized transport system substrate-binding protein
MWKDAMEMKRRYNARIQRTKGLLEMAAALYEGSLSYKTTRAAENVLQIESRVGATLKLALLARGFQRENGISLSFAAEGFGQIQAVAEGRISLAWINPSAAVTLAYRGKGPFRRSLPIRAIAVFPSYDVMGFAVHESTGLTSLAQIREERFPLRLSTGPADLRAAEKSPTMFTVAAVLRAAGFNLADIRKWGGKIQSVSRPSHPDRRSAIESDKVNAIFDEGIKSWGLTALERGFRYLPVEGEILKRLATMGYRPSMVPKSRFPGMAADVQTVDFSGWPMIVHAGMADDVAYALCEAIEARKEVMPTDNYRPLDMGELCANGDETPCDIPLHPGAERFYREKGYLK